MEMKNLSADEDLLRGSVADLEKNMIASALERTGGNQSEAARQLGTTRRIMMYRIRKYKIDMARFCTGVARKEGH